MLSNDDKQRLIRPYSGILAELFLLGDVLLIFACLWGLSLLYGVTWHSYFTIAGLAAATLFLLVSRPGGLYGSWRIAGLREELYQLCLVWALTLFGLLLLAYASKTSAVYSRRVLLTWMMTTPFLLCGYRIAIRLVLQRLRQGGHNQRNVAVIGDGAQAGRLAEIIQSSPWLGLHLAGRYSANYATKQAATDAVTRHEPLPAALGGLLARARSGEIDIIFLAMPVGRQAEQLVASLADTTASLYYVPNFFLADLLHARWGYLQDIPYLSLRETPFYGVDKTLKRTADVAFSVGILLLMCLPMLAIALAVRLSSGGPVLFRQRRYGLAGEQIEIWKFRTMRVAEDGPSIPQARRGDARITPLGAFLRRTSLDELPQFINVLQGQMSIVGPRPHAVAHNEQYRKQIYGYMLRHKVKPGITGWAQVNGWRGETDTLEKMENRIQHDLWYIQNWSLWLDIKIILLTIVRGFGAANAY